MLSTLRKAPILSALTVLLGGLLVGCCTFFGAKVLSRSSHRPEALWATGIVANEVGAEIMIKGRNLENASVFVVGTSQPDAYRLATPLLLREVKPDPSPSDASAQWLHATTPIALPGGSYLVRLFTSYGTTETATEATTEKPWDRSDVLRRYHELETALRSFDWSDTDAGKWVP